MALKGSYDFKGITISDAYLQVGSVNCYLNSHSTQELKTAAVYNSDGTLKTEAVYEEVWKKQPNCSCQIKVFKDKATRDASPNNQITEFGFSFPGSFVDSAKNHVKQAYVALKADDKYKDYADA